MTTPPVAPFWADLLPTPSRPAIQYHRISWFLNGSVTFELECLHEPLTSDFLCDAGCAEEDPDSFIEFMEVPEHRIPLRDGIVRTWWEGQDDGAELWWRYATDAEIEALPDVVHDPDHVKHVVTGVRGVVVGQDPARDGRYLIEWDGDFSDAPDSHDEADFERGAW